MRLLPCPPAWCKDSVRAKRRARMNTDDARIQSFLRLGYFIDYAKVRYPIDFSKIDKPRFASLSDAELIETGAIKLRETFDAQFESGRSHVVPLSGGLDCRLILGALLERTDASRIETYTLGIPGTYDYELGCLVAKHVGTRHMAFSLDKLSYHEDDLLDMARRADCQAALFYHAPIRVLDRLYGSSVVWSGYVGDAVAGSYVYAAPSRTLDEAKRNHLKRRTFVRSTKLYNCDDDAFLPYLASVPCDELTLDEQVLFAEAVPKFTAPHILFAGFEYKTPLINSPWMDFMFGLPYRHRREESLMIRVATERYPFLFGLPTKNSLGMKLGTSANLLRLFGYANKARKLAHQVAPFVTYPHVLCNDLNEGIRNSPDLRALTMENLQRLKRRHIVDWIDIDALVRAHDRRTRNHGDALSVLTSLELVLRAKGE